MASEQYRAILWDIGGVILEIDSFRDAQRRFVEELVTEYDVDIEPEQAHEEWNNTISSYFREREGTTFRSSRDAYACGVERIVGDALPESEWLPRFQDIQQESIRPSPGVIEVIERLADSTVEMAILSDVNTKEGKNMLSWFGILDAFDAITTSEEVGRTKPDSAMFEAALSKIEAGPAETLMIGDRYKHDMEGAAKVGVSTIAFGAEEGPEVNFSIEHPREILDIVGMDGYN